MKTQGFLTVGKNGSIKINKNCPRLGVHEVAVYLKLDIPDALFVKPALEATITIPKEVAAPTKITAEVMNNVEQAIKSVTGLEMRVSIAEEEKPAINQ